MILRDKSKESIAPSFSLMRRKRRYKTTDGLMPIHSHDSPGTSRDSDFSSGGQRRRPSLLKTSERHTGVEEGR